MSRSLLVLLLLPLTLACFATLRAAQVQAAPAALGVVSFLPQGEVEHMTHVSVRFSEAMRPLGVMEETAEASPLKLSAPGGMLPPGQFRWLDPNTLTYFFNAPVDGPLRIEASVPAGTRALSGAVLGKEVRWNLSTAKLSIELATKGSELPPKDAYMSIVTNYPLELAGLREKSRMSAGGKALAFEVEESGYSAPSYGNKTRWYYRFSIKETLKQDSEVTLDIAPGTALVGDFAPAPGARFSQKTYKALRLLEWRAGWRDDNKKGMAPEEPLSISFNNPVSSGELRSLLRIDPPVELRRGMYGEDEAAFARETVGSSHSLYYDWAPRTKYSVTLKAGLSDGYGTTLGKEQRFSFTTGDYRPFFHFTPGAFMERAEGGVAWLTLRNISPITLHLRYLPWENGKSRLAYRQNLRLDSSEDFPALAGAVEKTVTLDFSAQSNTNIRHALNIPELLGLNGPDAFRGFAELRFDFSKTETHSYDNAVYQYQITDIGLTFKAGVGSSLALVTDLETGAPLAGATLTLYSHADTVLWTGESDENGLAPIPGTSGDALDKGEMRLLIAEKDGDTCVLSLRSDLLPQYSSDMTSLPDEKRLWRVHALSQLPLYQPGEAVNFTVFARVFTDVKKTANGEAIQPAGDWQAVANEPVTVTVRDSRGQTVHSLEGHTNSYGAIAGEFTLSSEADLGYYSVQVESGRFERAADDYQAFQVASFRPPDFKVDVAGPEDQPRPLENDAQLTAAVTASYFSGATLADAETLLRYSQSDSYFAPPRLQGYQTGSDPYPFRYGYGPYMPRSGGHAYGSELTATLDETGKATFTLPRLAAEPGSPQRVSLEATVTDVTGLTTQGTAGFLLHPSALYVGLRTQRVAPVNKDVTVELKAAGWDDAPVDSAKIGLVAERALPDDNSETAWKKELLLDTPQGRPFSIRFEKSGVYTLTASITDAGGRMNIARTTVWVPGPDMEWTSRRGGAGLELMADKDGYAPGDTAQIMINNPYDSALALVTMERKGVRSWMLREVSGPAPTVEVPIAADDAPYVFATVTLVRGRTAPPPADPGHDLGSPRVLQGAVLLTVDDSPARLTVKVDTDSSSYRPGGTVAATASVADTTGKPRRAHVTLLAVDERILRAAGERTRYDPLQTFSAVYSCGVVSADIRTRLLNLGIPLLKDLQPEAAVMYSRMAGGMADMAPPPAAPAEGMAERGSGDDAVRRNFSPMAFWLAAGESGDDGKLDASFSLPDTLTSYRIVAVAADAGSDFATAEISVRATKPLQLSSAMPRFLTEGDRLEARILVQNTGNAAGTVSLRAEAEGMALETAEREIRLAAGEGGSVSFPLRAGNLPGTGTLTVRATMEQAGRQEKDAVLVELPILPAAPMTTVAAAGMLDEGGSYELPVQTPVPLDGRSSLEVVFAPSPAAGLSLVADELINYPWACLEQRLSRAWLRMLRLAHGDVLGLPASPEDLGVIKETLESVAKFQNYDGGFNLWPGMDSSSPYLTAYVLLVNREASALGLSIGGETAREARRYLHDKLMGHYDGETRKSRLEGDAMAIWALAGTDEDGIARQYLPLVLDLAGKTGTANPLVWGALLMASGEIPHLENLEKIRERIRTGLEKSAAITPTQMHFASYNDYGTWMTMGSTLRDNGMVLGAMARAMPEYPRLESLAYWVSQGLGEKTVLSTQEAIFGLWGLGSYLQSLGGNRPVSLQATWNEKESITKSFSRLIDAPERWVLPANRIENEGLSVLALKALGGRPYWTARLRYGSPTLPVRPENAGFTITRAWLTPGPWKMGDVVDVSVTVTVPATRRHVLLYDPFPAGLEPLHATRVDVAGREMRYQHPWQWQEAREDGMLLYAGEVQPGVYTYTYQLRAAAPGDFAMRPSRVEEMYTPEVFGRTNAETVTVTP